MSNVRTALRNITILLMVIGVVHIAKADCTSPTGVAGQMQWIAASSAVKYCNGTTWVTMNNTATATACSSAGAIQYVSSEIMFCNGSVWVKTAPATDHGTCLATAAGKFYYDPTGTYYWFCNGANWRRMGP